MGSAVWTSAERPASPPLGEDTTAKRRYTTGRLAVAYPPAILLGSADCVAGGDGYPVPVVPTLVGGVDMRCYGANPPSGPPGGMIFWLRPEELSALADGAAVTKWPDAGPYRNDLKPAFGYAAPVWKQGVGGSLGSVFFDKGQGLAWPYQLPFGSAQSLYWSAVAKPPPAADSTAAALLSTLPNDFSAWTVGYGFESFGDSYATNYQTIAPPFTAPAVFWVLHSGAALTVGLGSLPPIPVAWDPSGVLDFTGLVSLSTGPNPGAVVQVNEVLAWDRLLSQAEHAQVVAYLAGRSYLPLQ